MTALNDQQRATLLDRVFRRVGTLDDQSLVELDRIIQAAEKGLPISQPARQAPAQPLAAATQSKGNADQVSRRYFLAALTAGVVLAAGAGGAASVALSDDSVRKWLAEQGWLPTPTNSLPTPTPGPSPTLPSSQPPTFPAAARNQITGLENQVVALTTERDNLRQQVTSLGGQVRDANGQIVDLTAKNDNFQALIDLYKQLESIGLDQVINTALTSLATSLLAVDTVRTALNGGIAVTARVLQAVEDQLPLVSAGLAWLEEQVGKLTAGIRAFQTAMAVSTNTPVAKAITDFISQVLDILPFGVGQNMKAGLQALGEVLNHLPDLINNVSVMVLEPLRVWIGSNGQGGLRDSLLRPLREQLLAPAQQIVANAENLNTVYNTQLAQPVQSALDQRARIRGEIIKKAGALTG
jgi:hypothetical protein